MWDQGRGSSKPGRGQEDSRRDTRCVQFCDSLLCSIVFSSLANISLCAATELMEQSLQTPDGEEEALPSTLEAVSCRMVPLELSRCTPQQLVQMHCQLGDMMKCLVTELQTRLCHDSEKHWLAQNTQTVTDFFSQLKPGIYAFSPDLLDIFHLLGIFIQYLQLCFFHLSRQFLGNRHFLASAAHQTSSCRFYFLMDLKSELQLLFLVLIA